MELVVRRILSWQRDAQGGTVVLEVDIGGTIRETCQLVFPTDADLSAMERTFDNALSRTPPDHDVGSTNAA